MPRYMILALLLSATLLPTGCASPASMVAAASVQRQKQMIKEGHREIRAEKKAQASKY